MSDNQPPRAALRRLAWFVGIWAVSIAALGLISLAIKAMVKG